MGSEIGEVAAIFVLVTAMLALLGAFVQCASPRGQVAQVRTKVNHTKKTLQKCIINNLKNTLKNEDGEDADIFVQNLCRLFSVFVDTQNVERLDRKRSEINGCFVCLSIILAACIFVAVITYFELTSKELRDNWLVVSSIIATFVVGYSFLLGLFTGSGLKKIEDRHN